jgi:predicted amidophosphoribosyltransferase
MNYETKNNTTVWNSKATKTEKIKVPAHKAYDYVNLCQICADKINSIEPYCPSCESDITGEPPSYY